MKKAQAQRHANNMKDLLHNFKLKISNFKARARQLGNPPGRAQHYLCPLGGASPTRNLRSSGFTIIEVLIFVSLITMLFVVITYGITATLRDARISEKKIIATHHGDELKEWLRSEKETDWQVFISFIESSDSDTTTYCFPTNEENLGWNHLGPCADYDSNGFKRQVVLSLDSGHTQATIDIQVSWLDTKNNYHINNQTVFSVYE